MIKLKIKIPNQQKKSLKKKRKKKLPKILNKKVKIFRKIPQRKKK